MQDRDRYARHHRPHLAHSLASVKPLRTTEMVLAHHLVFGTYGFWLPNDPRGSWSTFVASWQLFLAGGKTTKTTTRYSLARSEHDREKRQRTKRAMKFAPVKFSGQQALAVAHGFSDAAREAEYSIHACSILRSHVHLVIGRTQRNITTVAGHLKSKASHRLRIAGLHPFENFEREDGSVPSCWAEGCWKVFLNSLDQVHRAIAYVADNPAKEGLPKSNMVTCEQVSGMTVGRGSQASRLN